MKIGVVADDLTGANATGVRLNKQGFTAATVVYSDEIPQLNELDAIIIDTDSRYAPDQTVTKRVGKAIRFFRKWDTKVICKRIDSTIRGKIGLEIDTVLEELEDDSVAIVVASFPDSGRISSGGYLLVDNIPVQETDVAKDPIMPIEHSYIPRVIGDQSQHKVSHIGLEDVLSGKDKLKKAIQQKINDGIRIIVIDAVTDEDIETIAETMATIRSVRLIPVDPGPLTAAYSRAFLHRLVDPSKVIVTVGSITSLTGRQLRYLMEKTNSKPVYVSAKKLASFDKSWDEEIERALNESLEKIEEEDVLIVTTHVEGAQRLDLKTIAEKQQTSQDALAKRITDGLAKITRLIMEKTTYPIQGCFTSGGDVTASLCALCLASGIQLEDEVLPLAAFGTLVDGHFPNMPIVTKGGMVGDKKAIYMCVKYLRTKNVKRSALP